MYARGFFCRIGSWLALFAVAMLFIAPVISTSLKAALACPSPPAMMAMPPMHHDMPAPTRCEQPMAAMPHLLMPTTGMSPMEEMACGYCQLLIHLPFVAFIFAVVLWQLGVRCRFVPFVSRYYPLIFRPWSPQRARAPPLPFLHSL